VFRDLIGTSKTKTAPPAASQQPSTPPSRPTSETVLSSDVHCEGQLTAKGNIRVDGTFKGDITTEGRIALGSEATIEGDVIGQSVMVGGIVRGNITARKVSITRTGRVWGDLQLEQLGTEEGSFIQGLITMQENVDVCAVIEACNERKNEVAGVEASEEEEAKHRLNPEEPLPVPVSAQYRSHRNPRP
jgi:cytoskeletal protein CcmA (bactofilin family)